MQDNVRWHCETGGAWIDLVKMKGRVHCAKGRDFIADNVGTRVRNGKERLGLICHETEMEIHDVIRPRVDASSGQCNNYC